MEMLDPILIHLYRLTGHPLADYFLGTFLLAFLTVLVGELTISLVFRVNRKHLETLNDRVERMKRLSEEALRRDDEKGYRAVNQEGNDAFGQLFFNKFGLSAASLWPIFIALAWMQGRFAQILLPLPLWGWGMNYLALFILCYIMARILFNRLKPRLPYFKSIHQALLAYDQKELGKENSI
jgi:hypothetical protein